MELYTHKNAETQEERRDEAVRTIKAGVTLIRDILKSTLGPMGALKILQGKETAVTNDGAYILKNLLIDSPSAKIIVSSSTSQDRDEGDGTTSIALLATLIILEAYSSTVHPIKLISGLALASARSVELLGRRKFVPKPEDVRNLVRTTLNSKVLSECLELFVDICVRAVDRVDDIQFIEIIKTEGELSESTLVDGFVLDSSVEVELVSPRIIVANTSLDYDKIKIMSSKINVNSISELTQIEQAEKDKMMSKVKRITDKPFDMFINRQIIYDYPMQLLRETGLVVVEHADFSGVERLNKVLGGSLISTFEELKEGDYGTCARVSNINVGSKRMIKFDGIRKGACSIILCGGSREFLEEAERSIHDALCVLSRVRQSPACLYGGGSTEMGLAVELSKYASEIKTKESEGIECLSRALQNIPAILAENCGFDGAEFKAALRSDHSYRRATHGLNVETGKPGCMRERGIVEGFEMKKRLILAACETAQTILKCDGLVKSKPRERSGH